MVLAKENSVNQGFTGAALWAAGGRVDLDVGLGLIIPSIIRHGSATTIYGM